jgi:hypothetical protein
LRRFRFSSGVWVGDVAGEPTRTTLQLRTQATSPITFLCAPIDSGPRLGGDRDEDAVLDGNDCNAADPGAWSVPGEMAGLRLSKTPATLVAWNDASASAGPGVGYEVLGGTLAGLRAAGLAATSCVATGLTAPAWTDPAPNPAAGTGRFWLARGRNSCGVGTAGPGRGALDALVCP